MKAYHKFVWPLALVFLVFLPVLLAADITSDDIIRLKAAGFSEDFIGEVISAGEIDVSVDEMIKMKNAGLEEATILKLFRKEPQRPAATTPPTTSAVSSSEKQRLKTGDFDVEELYIKNVSYIRKNQLPIPTQKKYYVRDLVMEGDYIKVVAEVDS